MWWRVEGRRKGGKIIKESMIRQKRARGRGGEKPREKKKEKEKKGEVV